MYIVLLSIQVLSLAVGMITKSRNTYIMSKTPGVDSHEDPTAYYEFQIPEIHHTQEPSCLEKSSASRPCISLHIVV